MTTQDTNSAEDAIFPSLANVHSDSDAILYLEMLGESTLVDHQFGRNVDYEWVTTKGGVTLLDGFGNYAVASGIQNTIFASTHAIIFQTSDELTLNVDEPAEIDLIFDPDILQTININIEEAAVTLHAATANEIIVEDQSTSESIIYKIGATTLTVTGTGKVDLTDVARDIEIAQIFESEAGVASTPQAENEAADEPGTSTDASTADLNPDDVEASEAYMLEQTDDLLIQYQYESIFTQRKMESNMTEYISENFEYDSADMVSTENASEVIYNQSLPEKQVAELETQSDQLVEELYMANDYSELVFHDALDLYFSL